MRILFLDLDTLRPDHLGCYGYHRNTSPHIDRIASEGVRFENYYCSDAPCLPSRSALVTGQFGINNGCINHGGTRAQMFPDGPDRSFQDRLHNGASIWALIRNAGLWTASVSPFAARHAAWHFNAGFRETIDTGRGGMESAEDVTPSAIDWIKRNAARDNWLLHVNYWDPHTPYRAPEEFGNPFKDNPLPAWLTPERISTFNKITGGHSPMDLSMFAPCDTKYPRHPQTAATEADVRRVIDGYDCGVRYMDGHIGQLLAELKGQGVLDDLVIIVTSDHGENLGEIGSMAEHGTADNITCRIPMIIRWPGKGKRGTTDKGLHYNLDLSPTLAEMLGKPCHPTWDGQSYAKAITEGADCGHEDLILSQCCHGAQRSVRWGDYIYIRTYHDFFHAAWPKEMLFNIKDDPHECDNLAAAMPQVCHEATHRYLEWHDRQMVKGVRDADPLVSILKEGGPFHSRHAVTANYCQRLKDTGREADLPEVIRRHPEVKV